MISNMKLHRYEAVHVTGAVNHENHSLSIEGHCDHHSYTLISNHFNAYHRMVFGPLTLVQKKHKTGAHHGKISAMCILFNDLQAFLTIFFLSIIIQVPLS